MENLSEANISVDFSIWDLAGQPNYSSIRPLFFQGANGAIVVFDITRPPTLTSLYNWIEELYEGTQEKIPIVVVANKEDLRKVESDVASYDEIKHQVSELENNFEIQIPLYITSAKTGLNTTEVFEHLAEMVIDFDGLTNSN